MAAVRSAPLLLLAGCAAGLRGELAETAHARGEGLCDPAVQQYSGYFKLTTGSAPKNYFYWFFESRGAPATDPVVLWMTGGPGCSSEVALFGENGPCTVDGDGKNGTTLNPYAWNSNANLLYIDQPAGTGFSWGTGMDHNEKQVAEDMYDFLQQFFKAHDTYAALPFFAFGESYAGHYVPAVTHKVFQNNKALAPGAIAINLKGTSVGNGLTDAAIQYPYYPEMAISTNGHKAVVGKAEYAVMKAAVPACVAAIKACRAQVVGLNITACVLAVDTCNLALLEPYQLSGRNVYDMRIPCEVKPLCYDFSNVATYLKRADVQATLGVDPAHKKWQDCNKEVNLEFQLTGDGLRDLSVMIPDQLEGGVRVLMYAGDQDYICNYLGNQAWTMGLEWSHKAEFNAATPANWTAAGKAAGLLRSANGFSFLQVHDAGHMVPRDQPAVALAMLNAFTSGDF